MDEKEIRLAKLKSVPHSVFLPIVFASAFALLNAIRILWRYQQDGEPLARGFFFAAIIGMVFISQSFSVVNKSKLGYLVLVIFSLAPAFGSLVLSLHAFRLLVVGDWAQDRIGLVVSVIGFLQFVTILALVTTLLRREVRDWVWKQIPAEAVLA
jgi:hypothetical protein